MSHQFSSRYREISHHIYSEDRGHHVPKLLTLKVANFEIENLSQGLREKLSLYWGERFTRVWFINRSLTLLDCC
jgi:hypothetical protein